MNLINVEKCPVCHSSDITFIGSRTSGVPLEVGELALGRCDICGSGFSSPRPTDEWMEEWYSSEYERETKKAEKGKTRRYVNLLGAEVTAHLDIGCGYGEFLKGVNAPLSIGVEVDTRRDGIRHINKVPLQHRFDLISLIHILEHLNDPHQMLEDVTKKAMKECQLLIEVPNFSARKLGTLYFAHTMGFTVPSLTKMVESHGWLTSRLIADKIITMLARRVP